MYWWAFVLFSGSPNCEAHGVKIAAFILPLCVALGNKVAALAPFVIGTLLIVISAISLKNKI